MNKERNHSHNNYKKLSRAVAAASLASAGVVGLATGAEAASHNQSTRISGSKILEVEQKVSESVGSQKPVYFFDALARVEDPKGTFYVENPLAEREHGAWLIGYFMQKGSGAGPVVNFFQETANVTLLKNPAENNAEIKRLPVVFPSNNGNTFNLFNAVNPETGTQYVYPSNQPMVVGYQFTSDKSAAPND